MDKSKRLKFNDPAPDLPVLNSDGKPVRLSSLWRKKPVLLNFIRHFGCPQCKQMLDMLGEMRLDLAKQGLSLAVITQGTPAETQVFCSRHAAGVFCYCDPERKAYAAYGLGRGGLRETFLSWRVWQANARAKREKGYRVELPPPGQDAFQMAGSFVIGKDGRIRLPYYYDDIADHPDATLLLQGVLQTDWSKPFDGPLGA
jgi:peroxiredoxin